MKKILVPLFCTVIAAPVLAQTNSEPFSPYWQVSLGVTGTNMQDFEYQTITVDASTDIISDSVISAALEYHWNEQWSASLQVLPEVSSCSFFCSSKQTNENGNLLDLDYQVNFYNLEAQYNYQISKRWSVLLSGGATVGREKITIRTCDYYHNSLFGRYCGKNADSSTSQYKNTQFGLLLGVAMNFQFAQHWGLRFDLKGSNYRQGYTQSTFSMSYRF